MILKVISNIILFSLLKAVWCFRGFVIESIKREFHIKYKNSLFGSLWAVLNPLAMIMVYTIIFSEVMKAKLPGVSGQFSYSIYLCAGILTWGLFSEIVSRSLTMFIENANLLKKLNFPRFSLPVIVVSSATVNFFIIFSLFTLFLIISGTFPGAEFVSVLPLVLLLILFSSGLGIALGVLNVFFRDVGQFMGVFMTFWFWLTPIVYPVDILNKSLQALLSYNPLFPIVRAFQVVLVQGSWPDWMSLIPVVVLTVILNVIGLVLFRKNSGDIVDEL